MAKHTHTHDAAAPLPEDCPVNEGEECPVVEDHKRRASDRASASIARVVMGVLALAGTSGGTWVLQERLSTQASATAVDERAREEARAARQDLAVFKAEIGGDVKAIRQQQDQMLETLRELRDAARRRVR